MTDDAAALIEPLPSGAAVEYIRDSMRYRVLELSGTRVRARLSLVADQGMCAVGTSNNTDFLRPVSVAEVEILAEAIFQGRTQQLWQVSITRLEDAKLVARGGLRLQNLPLADASANA